MNMVHKSDQRDIRAIHKSVEEHSGLLLPVKSKHQFVKAVKPMVCKNFLLVLIVSLAFTPGQTNAEHKHYSLYLKSSALTWYRAIPNIETLSYAADIVKALTDHINSPATYFALRLQVNSTESRFRPSQPQNM